MTCIAANTSTRNPTVRRALVISALAVAMTAPERADDPGLKRRIEALKKEVRMLKCELRASRQKTDAGTPSGPKMTMRVVVW